VAVLHQGARDNYLFIKSGFKYKNPEAQMSMRKAARSDEETRYAAPALEKGLDVLELLVAEQHGLPLQEIARRLGRTANELFRMLDVLVRRGYLARQADGTYALTLLLFDLAHRHPPVDRLVGAALPDMQSLARVIGQSAHLCVHHDARLVVLARAESPEPISYSVRPGAHFAFHDDRVSARVIAAFQADEKRAQFTEELLSGGKAVRGRRSSLAGRLATIREQGFDEGPSDTVPGVTDICFPLFDRFGIVAALNVVHVQQRDTRIAVPKARAALRETAATISRALGWRAAGGHDVDTKPASTATDRGAALRSRRSP
jgi:DNA-binding IclR family transcriptional regulator